MICLQNLYDIHITKKGSLNPSLISCIVTTEVEDEDENGE